MTTLLNVDGDNATIDAQFVVFEVRGKERPATGWPEGAVGTQGTMTPIESGYYRPVLRRVCMAHGRSIRCASSILFH
jgi:hypothetical protein